MDLNAVHGCISRLPGHHDLRYDRTRQLWTLRAGSGWLVASTPIRRCRRCGLEITDITTYSRYALSEREPA